MAMRLLRMPEVAKCLGVSEVTVRRWAWQGKIPVVRISRLVMVSEKDLDKLIDARTKPPRKGMAI